MEFVGLLFPILVEYLNKNIQNNDEKIVVCILTCVIAAVGIDWSIIVSGNFRNLHSVLTLAFLLFGESQLMFKAFWQPVMQDKFQQFIGTKQQG